MFIVSIMYINVAYVTLSIPIIIFLPIWTQPAMFVICSTIGITAHTIMYHAGYSYSEHVEGSSSVVYGEFIVAAHAFVNGPHCNHKNGHIICGVMVPALLIFIATITLIATASADNVSQPAHVGGVAGGIVVVSALMFHKKLVSRSNTGPTNDVSDYQSSQGTSIVSSTLQLDV